MRLGIRVSCGSWRTDNEGVSLSKTLSSPDWCSVKGSSMCTLCRSSLPESRTVSSHCCFLLLLHQQRQTEKPANETKMMPAMLPPTERAMSVCSDRLEVMKNADLIDRVLFETAMKAFLLRRMQVSLSIKDSGETREEIDRCNTVL